MSPHTVRLFDVRRGLGPVLLAGVTACSGSQGEDPAIGAQASEPVTARRLLPLEDDTVFSYETTTDAGDKGLMVLQIHTPRPGLVELDIAGRIQRLDVDDTSVMHSSGGYLLKDPIARGSTFRGAFGEVTILKVEQTVTVPAGTFERCVTTVEESAQPFKRAQSTYCPDIGLVSLFVEGSGDMDVTRLESRLKSHGPRVKL